MANRSESNIIALSLQEWLCSDGELLVEEHHLVTELTNDSRSVTPGIATRHSWSANTPAACYYLHSRRSIDSIVRTSASVASRTLPIVNPNGLHRFGRSIFCNLLSFKRVSHLFNTTYLQPFQIPPSNWPNLHFYLLFQVRYQAACLTTSFAR